MKKLFEEMQKNKETFSCNIDQVRLYKDALKLVSRKYDFTWIV